MPVLLDPETLVLMGGPCVGKTTCIKLIEQRGGFYVAQEEAAQLIREGKITIKNHWEEFQREVVRRQLAAEEALTKRTPRKPIFADRGIFDNVAYWRMKGQTPTGLPDMHGPRYKVAFLLEPLNIWVNDGVRSEDLEFCRLITPLLETAYIEQGVPVIRVPVLPPEERVDFILNAASQYLA